MIILVYIVVQILINTGHISSLMQGLLVPLCVYVILAVSLNLTVGILGELSLGHAGFMCVGAFVGAFFFQMHAGCDYCGPPPVLSLPFCQAPYLPAS